MSSMSRKNTLFAAATTLATIIIIACSFIFHAKELISLLFIVPVVWIFSLKKQRKEN